MRETSENAAVENPHDESPEAVAAGQLWRAPRRFELSAWLRVLVVAVCLAFAWALAEGFWPAARLENAEPEIPDPQSPAAEPVEEPAPDRGSMERAFFSRKLFIPEVPVASEGTTSETIERLKRRLTFVGVTTETVTVAEDGEEKEVERRCAWVRVAESSGETGGRSGYARSSQPSGESRLQKVCAGDKLLEFTVTEVADDGVQLEIEGFETELSR